MRYAARRDANEPELIQLAEGLGAFCIQEGPFDWWVWWRGRWSLVEVKRPQRKGHRNEYTKAQRALMADLQERAIPLWVWRTRADVLRDFDSRETA